MMISGDKIGDDHGRWRVWFWVCPSAMLTLAAATIFVLGLSIWTAVLATMLLSCPAIILWGAIHTRRRRQT